MATEDDLTGLRDAGAPHDRALAMAWLRANRDELSALPLPGSGATGERWRCFVAIAKDDLSLARLAEGHADAVAILAELGRADLSRDGTWGVWAAEPERTRAERTASAWRLSGEKRWCSGSVGLDRALVTATTRDGVRLFAVDTAAVHAEPGSWNPIGMAATASDTIAFDTAVDLDAEVGVPDSYVNRVGFWAGAMGVAACWYGGAVGVADLLEDRDEGEQDHRVSVRGRVRARLHGAAACLAAAAEWLDRSARSPSQIRPRALALRLVVEEHARAVLDDVTVTGGAGALAFDAAHARRVADLTVYLRQLDRHRAEVELGSDETMWWPW